MRSTGAMSGKSAVALGVMQMLTRTMRSVAVFRPIINEPQLDARDPDINLLITHFKLDMEYADAFAYTQAEARDIINKGSRNLLVENIIQKYKKLLQTHDFVLCIGTDFLGKDPVFEFELNAEISANLGCPVMLVTSGEDATARDISDSLQLVMESLEPYSLDVVATIINRSGLSQTELDELRKQLSQNGENALIYAVPNDPAIGRATMNDVKKGLRAEVLFGSSHMDKLVGDYLVAAMHVDNFLNYIEKDQLIITPGDRTDILLAAIASRLSSATPDIAGVYQRLTERDQAACSRRKACTGWSKAGAVPPCRFFPQRITPTAPSWPCRKSTASSSRATPAKSIRCLGFSNIMSTARKSPTASWPRANPTA